MKIILFTETYLPSFDKERDILNIVIDTAFLSFILTCFGVFGFCILICCYYDPRAAIFLGRLIPLKYFTPTFGVFITALHSYIILVASFNVLVLGMYVLLYIFYSTYILTRELRLGRAKYRAEGTLREADNLRHIYRALQICNILAMEIFGKFIFIFHGGFTILPIYVSTVLTHHWEQFQVFEIAPLLIFSPFAILFWTVVLEVGGYLYVKGRIIIASWRRIEGHWKSKVEAKLMRRFANSCTPITLCYGKRFVVKNLTLLKYHKGVARGILRALLTTKKAH